jgi:hypothetical protein
MPAFEEVAELVREWTNYDGPLAADTALQADLGVSGTDLLDVLEAYSERFAVGVSGYRWYFHSPEEWPTFAWLFSTPRYSRVPEILITVGMLHRFAEMGRWALEYPEHRPPRYGLDVWAWSAVLLGVLAAAAGGWVLSG